MKYHNQSLGVRSFEMIWIRIIDPGSLGSWSIEGTEESLVTDSSVPLMHHGPSCLGSLILNQIIPKKCSLSIDNRAGEGRAYGSLGNAIPEST